LPEGLYIFYFFFSCPLDDQTTKFSQNLPILDYLHHISRLVDIYDICFATVAMVITLGMLGRADYTLGFATHFVVFQKHALLVFLFSSVF